ncbi:RICIN domain-containing protein [Kitasatospora sp. NPDC089913]|uniref:RICIN domain-containing protein n=1 Tax=Kitasatospora sp. NPDC089913 TaxID=3364080 RepID=UPI00382B3499
MRVRKTLLGLSAASLTALMCAVAVPGVASAEAALPASALTLGRAVADTHADTRADGPQREAGARQAVTGTYIRINSLYSVTSGQCLDADANNGGNGTKVQVWGCNGSTQQEWISWSDYSIESVRFPGMCLDADTNGNGGNGTRVQLWQCNGATQQKWFVRANDVAIYNSRYNNGYNTVLDRDTNVSGNGAQAQLWQKNYQSQQWWRIVGA